MNYAVVILVFVFLLATGYWFLRGRLYYTGPRTRAHVVNGIIVADGDAELIGGDIEKAPPTTDGLNLRVPRGAAAEEL